MKVKMWGVRGSIASPGKQTCEYGGNTSCVELEDDAGNCFIFDAGTGIRELGLDLVKRKVKEIHLFIGHTHWDHIQGFPFFVPSFIPGNKIHIYGPTHYEKTLKKIMDLQMDYAYFPISMQQLAAKINYKDLKEEALEFGETKVVTKYSNHPVTGLCYKVISGGKTFVYTGDTEPYYNVLKNDPNKKTGNSDSSDGFDDGFGDDFGGGGDEDMDSIVEERNEHHKKFCTSDLLVHDAQYTAEEYTKFLGWGHSPMEHVIGMAKEAGVKKLVLTHHDPQRTDEQLEAIEKRLKKENEGFELVVAKEGMEIEV
jgi:phosphoribosyl 1,2-cyclic phosphodiesterase